MIMPTRLPDLSTKRRPSPDVTRRSFFRVLRARFTALPIDIALWLRCGRLPAFG